MAARVADGTAIHARVRGAKAEFTSLSRLTILRCSRRCLVWFQAQHTIPSPYVLGNIKSPVEGMDNLAVADMLGWPSDFRAWGRLIDWIISEADCHSRPADPESCGSLRCLAKCIIRPQKRTIQSHSASSPTRGCCDLKKVNCATVRGDEGKTRRFSRDESSRLASRFAPSCCAPREAIRFRQGAVQTNYRRRGSATIVVRRSYRILADHGSC